MVHHLCLLQLKPSVTPEQIENLMVETRIRLLKLPEITNLRVGKRIDTERNPHACFYSFETENTDKVRYVHDSAIFTQFEKQILNPQVAKAVVYEYEMEPGKDVRYS